MEIGKDPLAYPAAGLALPAGEGSIRPRPLSKEGGGNETGKRAAPAPARTRENEGVRQGAGRQRPSEAVTDGVVAEKIGKYE